MEMDMLDGLHQFIRFVEYDEDGYHYYGIQILDHSDDTEKWVDFCYPVNHVFRTQSKENRDLVYLGAIKAATENMDFIKRILE